MKKMKYLLVGFMLVIMTTGCVKFNANMNIKRDKSMDFTIIYAIDKTVFGEENKLKEEDMKNIQKQGFTVTKYSEGNMEGFTLSKKIKNIDEVSTESDVEYDLSGLMDENNNNKYIFKVVKGNSKNTYYAKFKFDANDSGLNMDEDKQLPDENNVTATFDGENPFDGMDFNKMMASMDLSFNVTLPHSAINSNATTQEDDNKKLSWKLTTTNQEYIEFAFELSNNESGINILYVGIGAVIIFLVIIVAIILRKKNSGTKELVNPKEVEETKTKDNDIETNIEPEPIINRKTSSIE